MRELLEAFVRQGTLAIERARLAEEAKTAALRARTEEMRSSLLSAVSHDLRTPLGAITGAGTALRDEGAGLSEAERAGLLDTICDEAERLERLVRNLLDMTRLVSGGLQVRREWVPLEELVGAALTRLDARLGGREISTTLPADAPLLSVDPVLLQQVFVNLLENATRHTPPGSPIEIRAELLPDAVAVEISDHGPGIPADSEERVFEKFFRGPKAGPGGVGLGLPICRGIIEAHGGTIRALATKGEGTGARFRIELPLLGEPPSIRGPDGTSDAPTETEAGP
jgi:two-component system sensor histidine kinase KdpD